MVYYITLDTIEYLAKGGRIGGAVCARKFRAEDQTADLCAPGYRHGRAGDPGPLARRPRWKGCTANFSGILTPKSGCISPCCTMPPKMKRGQWKRRLKHDYAPEELFVSIVTPTLGAHTGPRAVALCGYSD